MGKGQIGKSKKEQKKTKLVGAVLAITGFLLFSLLAMTGSMLAFAAMFLVIAGIALLMRSFMHVKFRKLKDK